MLCLNELQIGDRVVHISYLSLSGKVDGFTSDGKVVVVWKDNSIGRCYPENLVMATANSVERIPLGEKASEWFVQQLSNIQTKQLSKKLKRAYSVYKEMKYERK